MPRMLVDIERLLVALFTDALPDTMVAASLDVDSIDHLPLVIIRPIDGQSISNGPIGFGYHWQVNIAVLANGHEAASDLADEMYQAAHGFETTQARVAGVGYVRAVQDDLLPTRTGSVALADNLTQFNGQFIFTVRPDN